MLFLPSAFWKLSLSCAFQKLPGRGEQVSTAVVGAVAGVCWALQLGAAIFVSAISQFLMGYSTNMDLYLQCWLPAGWLEWICRYKFYLDLQSQLFFRANRFSLNDLPIQIQIMLSADNDLHIFLGLVDLYLSIFWGA